MVNATSFVEKNFMKIFYNQTVHLTEKFLMKKYFMKKTPIKHSLNDNVLGSTILTFFSRFFII